MDPPSVSLQHGKGEELLQCGGKTSSSFQTQEPPIERVEVETTVSPRELTVNLVTGALGVGIFSLPWSTAGASIVPSIIIILAVLLLNVFTLSIIVDAAERYQTFDIGSLLAALGGRLGSNLQIACNAAIWFSMFLCLIGYINVMEGAARGLVDIDIESPQRPFFVLGATLAVIPVCFLDMKYLSFTSLLAVLINIYIFGVMVWWPSKATEGVCYLGVGKGNIAMISAMFNATIIQMCVLPMYKELDGRSPAKFRRILYSSFTIIAILFVAFSIVGYLSFGPLVKSNILDNMQQGVPGVPTIPGNVAGGGAGIVIWAIYPIMLRPMIAPILNAPNLGNKKVIFTVASLGVVAATGFTAIYVTDLGLLNVVNGAFSCGVFVSTIPGVVGLRMLDRNGTAWRASMVVLLVGGLAMACLGFFYTNNFAEEITNIVKSVGGEDMVNAITPLTEHCVAGIGA